MIEKFVQVNKKKRPACRYHFGTVRKYSKGEVMDKWFKAKPLDQDYFQIILPRYNNMYTRKEIRVLASELLAIAKD